MDPISKNLLRGRRHLVSPSPLYNRSHFASRMYSGAWCIQDSACEWLLLDPFCTLLGCGNRWQHSLFLPPYPIASHLSVSVFGIVPLNVHNVQVQVLDLYTSQEITHATMINNSQFLIEQRADCRWRLDLQKTTFRKNLSLVINAAQVQHLSIFSALHFPVWPPIYEPDWKPNNGSILITFQGDQSGGWWRAALVGQMEETKHN